MRLLTTKRFALDGFADWRSFMLGFAYDPYFYSVWLYLGPWALALDFSLFVEEDCRG